MTYIISGKYLNGDTYFERLNFSDAYSTLDWIFRTDNKVHLFSSKANVIDWRTLTVETEEE